MLSPGKALVFLAVHLGCYGVYLGCTFAPNHKGMPVLTAEDELDFLRRQVLTSRNVRGGRLVTTALGGLNYQIEHHLFPSMPTANLRKARPIVRDYCRSIGVDYAECGLFASWGRLCATCTRWAVRCAAREVADRSIGRAIRKRAETRHDDPDRACQTVKLNDEEADALAELLGAPRIVQRLNQLQQQVEGLVSVRLPIPAGSPYAGRPMGEARVRTRAGASTVAVVRGGGWSPARGPISCSRWATSWSSWAVRTAPQRRPASWREGRGAGCTKPRSSSSSSVLSFSAWVCSARWPCASASLPSRSI